MEKQKDPAAVALGRKGGQVKSDAKKRAAVARNAVRRAAREAARKASEEVDK